LTESVGTAEDLHAEAAQATGLADFGPDDYTDGLAVLLAWLDRDADLTPRGRKVMRSVSWECLAHLPSYSAWLASADWTGAYRRHRRNLQLIGLPDAGRR
jgi:hypothetical protein